MLIDAPTTPLATGPAGPSAGLSQWLQTHRGAVAMAGLLAFAGPLTFFTGALSVMRQPSAVNIARLGLWWMLYGASLWCLLLAAGYGCERAARRYGRLVGGATWFLAACAAAVLTTLLAAGRATVLIEQGLVHSARTMHLNGFTFSLIMALLYFAHLRRSRQHAQATARLAAAQAAQRHARRRIVQARLQEMQARIDPNVLFEMLDAVRRLYEGDAARAEQFLDELVAFLRAALPRLRSASSSLLREVELARAYVALRALADASADGLMIEIAPEAKHARFPPGVLLPLLDNAAGIDAGPRRLAVTRAGDACRLVLTLAAAPPEASVRRVGSLLEQLLGASAPLKIGGTPGAMTVTVEVPYELA